MIADYVYAQDNQSDAGAHVRRGADHRLDGRAPCWRGPDRLRAVTAEQVRDAARRYLDKRHR